MPAVKWINDRARSLMFRLVAALERLGWLSPLPGGDSLRGAFEADAVERCRWGVRVFCTFAAALLVASAVYSFVSEASRFDLLLHIRIAALVGEAAILVLLNSRRGREYPRELGLALVVVLTLTIHSLAQATGGQLSPQYDRLTLVILGPAVFMSWSAGWQLLSCFLVGVVYTAGTAAAAELQSPHFVGIVGRLLAVSVVSIAATVVRERMRWRQVWYIHELSEARRRAEKQGQRLNEELERRVLARTAELHASEQRFRTMFDAAPIGVISIDANGCLLEANRAFEAMLGYASGALRGRPISELIAADDRWRFAQAHTRLRAGGHLALPLDGHYLRRDGVAVATHEAVTAIHDASGRFAYALAMVENVSERRHAEESARRHQEHLAHVLRVSTMGEMAAQLAHELNQPLGAIVNFANAVGAILRERGADPELGDAVARIATEGLRAGEIIRRVREFVRRSAGPRPATDLNHLVRESVLLVENDARRQGIGIQLDLDAALPPVRLDAIQVEQVILNLLRNAIEAMAAATDGDHEMRVRTSVAVDGSVELSVRDTGIGMEEGDGDRIFDAFFTTKAGGLGMGLSISRSIVEAHDGRLWAHANSDRGTTFTFVLPATAAEAAA